MLLFICLAKRGHCMVLLSRRRRHSLHFTCWPVEFKDAVRLHTSGVVTVACMAGECVERMMGLMFWTKRPNETSHFYFFVRMIDFYLRISIEYY